jgi:hypothetical protein
MKLLEATQIISTKNLTSSIIYYDINRKADEKYFFGIFT